MSPPDNRRSCFLRELSVADFVPPEDRVIAVNALPGTALPVSSCSSLPPAFGFGKEVEQFVAAYWSLPPAERRARWADLSRRAPGALAARVRRLELGLDVSAIPHPDPGAEEVASLIRSLFLLPPRARAIRRAQWLAERADKRKLVIAAANKIRSDKLSIIYLESRLFDLLRQSNVPFSVPWSPPRITWWKTFDNFVDKLLKIYVAGFVNIVVILIIGIVFLRIIVQIFSADLGSIPTQPTSDPYGYDLSRSMEGLSPKIPTTSPTGKSAAPTNRR